MKHQRLGDYLDHIAQAALDAQGFVEGMDEAGFLADKRTQQAVVMSFIIMGEAATRLMDGYPDFFSGPVRSLLAQHAQHAQSNGTWVFRYRPQHCVGDALGLGARIA